MPPIESADVLKALGRVVHPDVHKPIVQIGLVENVSVSNGTVQVEMRLPSPWPLGQALKSEIEAAIKALPGGNMQGVEFKTSWVVPGREVTSEDPIGSVKNIVLVLSGKGGVGKSTVAANVAMSLVRAGAAVGLLDADMYGPSMPTMFGIEARPRAVDGKIEPVVRFDLKLMSLGFLLEDPKAAVIWRGPMLHHALTQFFTDVSWGKLDYLVCDLPPGTGDVALTIAQRVQATGAVVVTTPQDVALADVYKSISMCQKVNIPILGVVENMSSFVCPHCDKETDIFGTEGGKKAAAFAQAPLLGRIPIDPRIRVGGDAGTPVVVSAPESSVARAFDAVAERLAAAIGAIHIGRRGTLSAKTQTTTRLPIVR